MPFPTMIKKTLLLILLLSSPFYGCQTKSSQEDEQSSAPSDGDSSALSADINSNQSELFKTIIGDNEKGIFRGISFGDHISKVRELETFEMLEDSSDHIGYTFDTPQLETIDILYYHPANNQLINKISADIYLNSANAVGSLWKECSSYFSNRYGKPLQSSATVITWMSGEGKVTLTNVSKDIDFGIKLSFEPAASQAIALNH